MRAPRSPHSLLAVLFVLGVARAGRADDPRGAARAHYARGLELAGQNGYEAALREFNEAYVISPQFAVLYNIGQAHVALGHPAEAIETLSKYLHDAQDRLPPGRREQVEVQIALLRARLARDLPASSPEAEAARAAAAAANASSGGAVAAAEAVRALARPATLSVRCAEPGVKVVLDGKNLDPASATRGVPVAAGLHHVTLAGSGRRSPDQTLDVPAGAAAIVICQNLPAAPAVDPPRVSLDGPPVFSEAPARPTAPEIRASTVGYALGGLGVALGGAALGVYLWNRGQYHDAQAELAQLDRLRQQVPATDVYSPSVAYNAHVDAIQRASYITTGLALTGAALMASGFYLWHSDPRRADKAGQRVARRSWGEVSPGGISWNGVW